MPKSLSIRLATAFFLFLSSLGNVSAAEPLVDADWVQRNVGSPGVMYFDLRSADAFQARHIPGAIRSPFDQVIWQFRPQSGPNALAPERAFAARMSSIGITNNHHVVLVHAGRLFTDVAAATQVYWVFKLMGHEEISILSGGMRAYAFRQTRLETGGSFPRATSLYRPKFNPKILATRQQVAEAIENRETLVDYRPEGHYLGINRAEFLARAGTIPGAKNISAALLNINGGGQTRPISKYPDLYNLKRINVSSPHIAFSNVGMLASLGWFIAHELLGNTGVRLYSPGLISWAADPRNPLERQMDFD